MMASVCFLSLQTLHIPCQGFGKVGGRPAAPQAARPCATGSGVKRAAPSQPPLTPEKGSLPGCLCPGSARHQGARGNGLLRVPCEGAAGWNGSAQCCPAEMLPQPPMGGPAVIFNELFSSHIKRTNKCNFNNTFHLPKILPFQRVINLKNC